MQLRRVLIASLISLGACGGGSKPAPVEPAPVAEPAPAPTPTPEPAVAPPVAEAPAPAPAPAPPPIVRVAIGDVKIAVKGAKKTEVSGEITLAADGTVAAKMTSSVKKETKTLAASLNVSGELAVDGEAIARLGDDGSVEALQVTEEKQDGATVKAERKYEVIGTLDDAGTFTKKSGKKITIDAKGKVSGMPRDLALTVTAKPEHRKAAMLIVMGMLGSSRMTSDVTTSSKPAPAAPPAAVGPAAPAAPATPAKK